MGAITIFTDGSSRGNPGPGGWAAVIVKQEEGDYSRSDRMGVKKGVMKVTELGGGEKNTTNNRMELMAAIKGLERIKRSKDSEKEGGGRVTIFTDSSYVVNGMTKWMRGWKDNGWQTKTKEDVLNKDLWRRLDEAIADIGSPESARSAAGVKVVFRYIGGHVGILGNERCDHIATSFADGMKIKLYDGPLAGYDLPKILDISLDEAKYSRKSSNSAHSRAKAYSYVSMVDGIIETHHAWAECEKRVKGASGAKYKKAVSAADEQQIIAEFEAI